jgi:hypothetical protein
MASHCPRGRSKLDAPAEVVGDLQLPVWADDVHRVGCQCDVVVIAGVNDGPRRVSRDDARQLTLSIGRKIEDDDVRQCAIGLQARKS